MEHNATTFDLWNDQVPSDVPEWGKYIAISGNTGAGKSTLVRAIVQNAQTNFIQLIGIDERTLHHPFLRLMFSKPTEYSFAIQVNFLLQRHLLLLRWLSSGYSVVIERSHLDDSLFVEHLKEQGIITIEEYNAYAALSNALHKKIPLPDIFICLDVDPTVSMARIAQSEQMAERPIEFPNDSIKYSFVASWNKKYIAFHEALTEKVENDPNFKKMILAKYPAGIAIQNIVDDLIDNLREIVAND